MVCGKKEKNILFGKWFRSYSLQLFILIIGFHVLHRQSSKQLLGSHLGKKLQGSKKRRKRSHVQLIVSVIEVGIKPKDLFLETEWGNRLSERWYSRKRSLGTQTINPAFGLRCQKHLFNDLLRGKTKSMFEHYFTAEIFFRWLRWQN